MARESLVLPGSRKWPGAGSKVAIVLATYNGASHLEEQIRSVQDQEFTRWQLFVRDDGSADATPARLARLVKEDERVTLLEGGERLGAIRNFSELLLHAYRAGADYVFPCDQDDVWRPGKMSRALALMSRLEGEHGSDVPLLVHSDLEVVAEDLRQIHPSFLRYQGIRHEEANPLRVLVVQNFVTGCASLLNRPLLELGLPIPECCIMHDWWLAQCAASRGRIGFIPQATVRYRQHGGNEVGAAGVFGNLNPFHAQGRRRLARSWRVALQSLDQARALRERLRERGGAQAEILELLDTYAHLGGERPGPRLRTLRRLGIRRQRPLGTALLYARVALLGVGTGGSRIRRGP